MNIQKLKEIVEEIELYQQIGESGYAIRRLVKFLYDESNGHLIDYFYMIDEIRRKEIEEEKLVLYRGLEDAMHSMSHFSSLIEEDASKKELKGINDIFFHPSDGNIAFIINIAKAYFPDGVYQNASNSGVSFFNKFRTLLRENKHLYLEGGSSHEWAKQHNHLDYIKLVLEKDPDKNEDTTSK